MASIFTKILNKEIPCSEVAESKNSFAFLDIMPVNKGHTLVIPRKEYEKLDDIPDEELMDLILLVKKVSIALKKTFNTEHYSIVERNGRFAGQEVPHVHFHVVPRYENDGHLNWSQKEEYSEGEMNEIAEKIKNSL